MKKMLFFLILMLVSFYLSGQSTEGEEYIWIVPPQFEDAKSFYDGLAIIKKDGKYGYIDKNGTIVVEPVYDEAINFSEGLAPVKVGTKWKFIDKYGNDKTNLIFSDAWGFSDGLALIELNGKMGYMETDGTINYPEKYDPFLKFKSNRKKNFFIYSYSEGLCRVERDREFGYFDQFFNTVINFSYEDAGDFKEGLAAVKKNGQWGYIDKYGEMVIKPQFEAATYFSEGLAAVTISGKRGYIDKNGVLMINSIYEGGTVFKNGLAAVKFDGKIGVINKKGEFIVQPQFEKGSMPSDNLMAAQYDGLFGYIKISRDRKQIKKAPTITWENPINPNTITESEKFFIQSCIQSEDNVNITLLVDGKEYSKRDFIIKKITNVCNIKYEQWVEIKPIGKSVEITILATNSVGTTRSSRIVEVKELPIEKKENIKNENSKKIALIIGNNNYSGGGLKNAINDANDLSMALTSLGFETYLYTDLDQKEMKKSIIYFGSKLNPGCTALFFYAGHGIQTKGTNYLVPIDAQLDKEANVDIECVSMNSILQQMESAKSKNNFVILDACRNNPWERSWNRSGNQNGLGKMDAPLETLILYATKPGSTADDGGDSKNGVFTSELLINIKKPGLSIYEVFRNTSAGVRNTTKDKQIPWIEGTFTGDFYFVK